MNNIVDLNKKKNANRYKKIYNDLLLIKNILTLTMKALDFYPDYAIVKNMSTFISGQLVILNAQIKKYEELVNGKN